MSPPQGFQIALPLRRRSVTFRRWRAQYGGSAGHADAVGQRSEQARRTALEWLEKAVQTRDAGCSWLKVDPQFDPLRSDPRFQSILRRMNFPE